VPDPELSAQVVIGPAVQVLAEVAARAGDLRPVYLGPLKNSLDQFFTSQFSTAGAEGGTPWAPLTPATLASKARSHRAGMGILRFTNRLWASLVKPTPANLGISRASENLYFRGTQVPYALFHQYGYTVSRWGKQLFHNPRAVPARPLIPVRMPTAYVEAWARSVQRYVVDGVVE